MNRSRIVNIRSTIDYFGPLTGKNITTIVPLPIYQLNKVLYVPHNARNTYMYIFLILFSAEKRKENKENSLL